MALKLNAFLKNQVVDRIIVNLAGTTGTAGTAQVKVYTGSQPSDADQATSGNLICTLSSISWSSCTNGTAPLTGQFSGTNSAAGTAGWARFETVNANGTARLDGNVGTAATSTFVINNPIFATAGGDVTLLTGSLYIS